jgi:hypothetical protein
MSTLFMLNGLPRVGKDTTADYLVAKYNFKRYTFAEPFKTLAKQLYNLSSIDFNFLETHKDIPFSNDEFSFLQGRTWREYLIALSEGIKAVTQNERIWIDTVFRKIEEDNWPDRIVITDLGFPDELESFSKLKTYETKVVRISNLKQQVLPDSRKLFLYDYLIRNNGSRSDLYTAIDLLVTDHYATH